MAKIQKKKISKIRVKKKHWFKIIAPKMFGSKEIGETYLITADKAIGRKLTVNLKDITGNVKDQKAQVSFQISKAENNVLKTTTIGYQLTSAYVKRVVRKNTRRLDDYFILKSKGGKDVLIKTLLVTLNKVQRSRGSLLRKQLHDLLKEEVNKTDFATLLNKIVLNKLQIELKKKLHKACPVKEVAIRVLELKEKGIVKEEITVTHEIKKEAEPQKEKAE